MSAALNPDDKVKYHTGDEKWKNGVIHGARFVDDVDGTPRVLTYLIDTGAHERIDVFQRDLRDEFVNHEVEKLLAKGLQLHEAHQKLADSKLPPSQVVEDIVRQPQQVDVRPEHVKTR
jgi:hypothetical protein